MFRNKPNLATFVPVSRPKSNTYTDAFRMTKNDRTSSVMRQIDENLRRVYKDEQAKEVPDRFKDLLQRLKDRDGDARDD